MSSKFKSTAHPVLGLGLCYLSNLLLEFLASILASTRYSRLAQYLFIIPTTCWKTHHRLHGK